MNTAIVTLVVVLQSGNGLFSTELPNMAACEARKQAFVQQTNVQQYKAKCISGKVDLMTFDVNTMSKAK